MQNPQNLKVYAQARKVAVATYALTHSFAPHERYGLTSQMRRAAVSVGSNIAEGCGRQGNRALVAFLHNSLGSASELEFQLLVATDVGLCPEDVAALLSVEVGLLKAMLARLIVRLRGRPDLPS